MFDAVVVGARCAGAATALLLARQGHRVLIVDQAHFPSDVRLSTHLVWHAGVDLLDRWGLLQALQDSGCPLLTDFTLDMGGLVLQGQPPATRVGAAMAPRRVVLDQVLLDAAVAAGAELREGVTFEGVLRERDSADGRVCGIRGRLQDGQPVQFEARVVVGADGTHSPLARAVGARALVHHPKDDGSYNAYAYFSGLPVDAVEFHSRPERMAYAWSTHHGQTLVGVILPGRAPRVPLAEVEAMVMRELHAHAPSLAERVRGAQREGDWTAASVGSHCREAAGAGWALVGDAGVTVDPVTAAGITLALRDAELLSGLLHEGLLQDGSSGQRALDAALAHFGPQRDAVSRPLHQFAQDMAQLQVPPQEMVDVFMALAGQQAQIDRYFGVFGQTVTPAEFFDPANLQAILYGAVTPA
ncbi:flavin-dependent dehydrogenase [Aquabacterium commune]|uniref:Flavin-dependent dehydrogenase n=1 Tax=Aquabacterium commune TaxID=70586 RepID=A0A4R6RHW9_9BURK|nr:FAD-dependent monooxygenase [Aquabacterium commune]TDP86059.1 flavin-dependent dehydrogenase [Aquabacterium commune]